jgi:xylulokinase
MLHWVTDIRDINYVRYDKGLIKKLGIEKSRLPELKHSIDILGNVSPESADQLGVNRETMVVMGAPDVHAAVIGSGAVSDYEGHIYIGTSSWVICHVPFKKTDIFNNIATLPSAIPGRYFVTAVQEIAGGCLTFLRDNIMYPEGDVRCGDPEVYKDFDNIVEKVTPGSKGLIFTPWLYGERAPIEDHTIRGGLHNISLPIKLEDIIRAVFEGVTYNSRWLFELVEKFIKRKMNPVNIIGGGAQSDIWCQIYADVLNRTIRQVKDPIMANARGAAFLASVGLGYTTFDEIPSLIQFSNIFEPNPDNRELYDSLFKEFLVIYKNNKAMYRRLNQHQ